MIHVNGSATRSTRSHAHIRNDDVQILQIIRRRLCAHTCVNFVDAGAHACAFMALGHANLVVARSSTPEKPRPTLLFGKENISHEGGRSSF